MITGNKGRLLLGTSQNRGHGSHLTSSIVNITEKTIAEIKAFKASEQENDPARMPDMRGPYEIMHQRKFGCLPKGIWNLRAEESRSGLLWQVLSGILDAPEHQAFASTYMALALEKNLSPEEYRRDLIKLNRDFGNHLERGNFMSDHHHGVMSETYNRVTCAQCSMLTALARQDKQIHELFVKDLLPLKTPQERMEYLKTKGLLPLLDTMIPSAKPQPKL